MNKPGRFISLKNQWMLLMLAAGTLVWGLVELGQHQADRNWLAQDQITTRQSISTRLSSALLAAAEQDANLAVSLANHVSPLDPSALSHTWPTAQLPEGWLHLSWHLNSVPAVLGDDSPLPAWQLHALLEKERQSGMRQRQVICQQNCFTLQTIPLASAGQPGQLVLIAELQPRLAQLAQQLDVQITLLFSPVPSSTEPSLWLSGWERQPLLSASPAVSQRQLLMLADQTALQQLQAAGTGKLAWFEGRPYQHWLLPLAPTPGDSEPTLLLSRSLEPLLAAQSARRWEVRLWLSLGLGILLLVAYAFNQRITHRLLRLTHLLPELPELGYEGLKQRLASWPLTDELARLQQAAFSLADRLDQGEQTTEAQRARQLLGDPLTGQLNRSGFMFELDRILMAMRRQPSLTALILLDMDRFTTVNDTLGHDCGDKLLRCLAKRLKKKLRETDVLAHLGGDEFGILLCHLKMQDDIPVIVNKLLDQIRNPVRIGNQLVYLTASAGVSITQTPELNGTELLQQASLALNEAKQRGRNGYQLFVHTLFKESARRHFIETQLESSLENGQLYLCYQPQLDLLSGQITALEALAHWRNPEEGNISPAEFIPILENSDRILQFSHWTLEQAISQLAELDRQGHKELQMAINLSAHQLLDPELGPLLANLCQTHQIRPGRVILEVAESAIIPQYRQARERLLLLRQQGYQLAIDDFGTGYSPPAYLNKLPFDLVKLDRTFVQKMAESDLDRQLLLSIVQMVQTMGKLVVAEGVEEKSQLQQLQLFGCNRAQGFFILHPLGDYNLASKLEHLSQYWRQHLHTGKPAPGHPTPPGPGSLSH